MERFLTIPFISDPSRTLISAYGAKNPIGDTLRQSFILDTTGKIRWIERNVEFGAGNFNLDNHASRVLRELYTIHNRDGWGV